MKKITELEQKVLDDYIAENWGNAEHLSMEVRMTIFNSYEVQCRLYQHMLKYSEKRF